MNPVRLAFLRFRTVTAGDPDVSEPLCVDGRLDAMLPRPAEYGFLEPPEGVDQQGAEKFSRVESNAAMDF